MALCEGCSFVLHCTASTAAGRQPALLVKVVIALKQEDAREAAGGLKLKRV